VKQNNAKLWLNTADVNVYFSQTVKRSNKGMIAFHNVLTVQIFTVYTKNTHLQ